MCRQGWMKNGRSIHALLCIVSCGRAWVRFYNDKSKKTGASLSFQMPSRNPDTQSDPAQRRRVNSHLASSRCPQKLIPGGERCLPLPLPLLGPTLLACVYFPNGPLLIAIYFNHNGFACSIPSFRLRQFLPKFSFTP